MSNGFPFAFGPPPTAEERLDHLKKVQGTARATVPLCEEILAKLRELQELLPESGGVASARKKMALVLEDQRFRSEHLK